MVALTLILDPPDMVNMGLLINRTKAAATKATTLLGTVAAINNTEKVRMIERKERVMARTTVLKRVGRSLHPHREFKRKTKLSDRSLNAKTSPRQQERHLLKRKSKQRPKSLSRNYL